MIDCDNTSTISVGSFTVRGLPSTVEVLYILVSTSRFASVNLKHTLIEMCFCCLACHVYWCDRLRDVWGLHASCRNSPISTWTTAHLTRTCASAFLLGTGKPWLYECAFMLFCFRNSVVLTLIIDLQWLFNADLLTKVKHMWRWFP